MSPHMGVDPEQVKAPKPVPGNQWYKLKVKGIKVKNSKDKQSHNYEILTEIVENKPEYNGTKIYCRLNTKFARAWVDLSHALGFPLNPDGSFVGTWEFDPADPENVEKAQYKGPLLGKIMDAELVVTSYQGNEKNEPKQYRCTIEGCATKFPDIKHMTNLIGNK